MINNILKPGIKRVFSFLRMKNTNGASTVMSRVCPVNVPLAPDYETGWKPYPLFNGSTPVLSGLSCHVSVLLPGHSPHLPHAHDEEEILICLRGEVDLTFQNRSSTDGYEQRRLKPGQFVYYPAQFSHTLQAVSDEPANYLMFKWQRPFRKNDAALGFGYFDAASFWEASKNKEGFCPRVVFEGPTNYLKKLHCHCSTLSGGAGYDSHVDPYDVAIIVFEGEVETLGERCGPHSVIFYTAGQPHDMKNPGKSTAKYIVFEFHG